MFFFFTHERHCIYLNYFFISQLLFGNCLCMLVASTRGPCIRLLVFARLPIIPALQFFIPSLWPHHALLSKSPGKKRSFDGKFARGEIFLHENDLTNGFSAISLRSFGPSKPSFKMPRHLLLPLVLSYISPCPHICVHGENIKWYN